MVDRPRQSADDDNAEAEPRRRLGWKLAGAGLGLVVLLLACVLWIPRLLYPSLTDSELEDVRAAQDKPDEAKVLELINARLKLQNDARTTLLQGLGALLLLTGAGIGAAVTLRQVRATRDQIRETATASRNQLKLSEQGLVTDRYTRAVEQLGHDKAPVRLGALYSLEHLAQDNPQYRHTVVDVVCAYLRMPFTPLAQTELDAARVQETALPANGQEQAPHPGPGGDPIREELQVRQTAQRLLASHLRCPPQTSAKEAQLLPPSPQQDFWPDISLDLTGATLVDFNFAQVSVIQAQFVGATFQGLTSFFEATFQGAWFNEATFQGASFGEATFQEYASFTEATFQGAVRFNNATFQGAAWFREATFQGLTYFNGVTFQAAAVFKEATFQRHILFNEATFQAAAVFEEATFQGVAVFEEATFQGHTLFNEARVLHFNNLDRPRVWPDGWTVRPDPTDPSRGTLVRAAPANEPEPAVPPSNPTDNAPGTG
jgi:uncharacterized protein YjbI with pentapeptide repeats